MIMAKSTQRPSGRERQKGVALLVALFVLLLLSAIGLAMMYATNTETSINANFKDKQTAVYAALSGIHEARERIIPSHCSTSDVPWAICAPSAAPDSVAPTGASSVTVQYIINPSSGETIDPTDISNPYFDTELCHENILGLTNPGSGTPCDPATTPTTKVIPAVNKWVDITHYDDSSTSFTNPFHLSSPLTLKWTRIARKSNNMGLVPVNGNASDAGVVCWDGKNQIPKPAGYNDDCSPPHSLKSISFVAPYSTCTVSGVPNQPCSMNWSTLPNIVVSASPTGDTPVVTPVQGAGSGSGALTIVLDTHGSGYTAAPDVVIASGGAGSGAAATANVTLGSPIIGLASSVLGTQCYPTAGTVFSVGFTGGGGSGAQAIATVGTTQKCLYSLKVSASGCGHNSVLNVGVSGAGTGFAVESGFTLTADNSGKITAGTNIQIGNPGTTAPGGVPTVSITDPSNHHNDCNSVSTSAVWGYELASVVIDTANEGSGYTSNPTLVVTGAGAVGDAGLEGSATGTRGTAVSSVVSITQSSGGTGYTSAPAISFVCNTNPGCLPAGGVAATGHSSVSPYFTIVGFTFTGGTGYTTPPTVTFQCPGGGTGCGGDGTTLLAHLTGTANLTYGKVYQLTSLGVTKTGARAMTQSEVVTNVTGMAHSGALTLDGPAPDLSHWTNSSNFYVSGDPSTIPAGDVACSSTAKVPAIGAYDDPNSPTTPTSVQSITDTIPSGRTSNYMGSGPSPDVQNVYGSLGDTLGTTGGLQSLATDVYTQANLNGTAYASSVSSVNMGSSSNYVVDYVNGDATLSGTSDGWGTLFVTGKLEFKGNFTWHGMVFVVGAGSIAFSGGGGGSVDGSVIVANICSGASPCNMPHGQVQSPNALLGVQGTPSYSYSGGGTNNIQYNPCAVDNAMSGFYVTTHPQSTPLRVISSRTVSY
jgi:hypothetical protein